jgi:glucan phosphoethanolaminetransferase (alkaline phosphatase superfamily)
MAIFCIALLSLFLCGYQLEKLGKEDISNIVLCFLIINAAILIWNIYIYYEVKHNNLASNPEVFLIIVVISFLINLTTLVLSLKYRGKIGVRSRH